MDTTPATVDETEEQPVIMGELLPPVEEEGPPPLNGILLQNGLPLFIGDVKDVVERIKAFDNPSYPIFYVLGYHRDSVTKGSGTTTWQEQQPPVPRVFKVVQNFVGYSISLVEGDMLGLTELKPQATMALPLIPYELIQKIGAFFRAAYKAHGTEAIVLLTYDPRKEGSDGWGILVPDQKNTSAHCKYEPESIIDDKDDEVVIVGSAHSHPGMSAFASGTDHHDQDQNDGLHITAGWKGNSNTTEWYIELQMGGTAFTFQEAVVFENSPEPPPFPEVDEWVKKVSKQGTVTSYYPPHQGHHQTGTTKSGGAPGSASASGAWSGYTSGQDTGAYYDQNHRPFRLPEGCPDIRENTVVARLISDEEPTCPTCKSFISPDDITDRRRCYLCMTFFLLPNETVEDIVKLRDENKAPTFQLEPDKAPRSILVWERWEEDEPTSTLPGLQTVTRTVVKTSVDIYFEVDSAKKD